MMKMAVSEKALYEPRNRELERIEQKPEPAKTSTYVNFRMQEWRIGEQSQRMQTCVRKILNELVAEALPRLKDPRLEVMVTPVTIGCGSVWAYYPVHRKRWIARQLSPKPQTRVLLVLSTAGFEEEPVRLLKDYLRDHLGHALLYLRDPKARNECSDAQREWQRSVRL